MKVLTCAVSITLVASMAIVILAQVPKSDPEWTVKISGGHETDERDHGRPVILIAAGLGVKPEVFREAFSHVQPAPAGERPTEERAQENKRALLSALGKYGVKNDRLDEVSNYYRYRPGHGELWPTKAASAMVLKSDGVVTGFKVTSGGSGYSSAPTITVTGHPEIKAVVTLSFGKEFGQNGSISEIKLLKK